MNPRLVSGHLQANYDGYYSDGQSEWRRLGAIGKAENIISLCSDLRQESVLEVGAGEGAVLSRLAELGFGANLYAVEISASGVEAIKNRSIPHLAECALFDGYHIPYPDDKFDVVILSHVLEHVEYPRQLLYEATRVARCVFIEVPLEDTWRLSNEFIFDQVGHINDFSPKTIRRLVQSCGLQVLRQLTTNPARGTYTYRKGRKGLISYYTKKALLAAWPQLATAIFTYHAALVCKREKGVRENSGARVREVAYTSDDKGRSPGSI